MRLVALGLALLALHSPLSALRAEQRAVVPERVTFDSRDGRTTLVGYLYLPVASRAERAPAVVMMHGRQGPYSDRANGVYEANTLSTRHKAWGRIWAEAGYVALLVDGFGPRGYPKGFPRGSYDERPEELNEVTVRPLDAYGALAYLRSRADVSADRIGLQGWSNGGSAAISAMDVEVPGIEAPTLLTGFRAALAFYPACGLKGHFDQRAFRPYAPTLVFHGTADEEVSYKRCAGLVEKARAGGGDVEIKIYEGATHSFDSPASKRQKLDANAESTEDAIERSLHFFASKFAGAP